MITGLKTLGQEDRPERPAHSFSAPFGPSVPGFSVTRWPSCASKIEQAPAAVRQCGETLGGQNRIKEEKTKRRYLRNYIRKL